MKVFFPVVSFKIFFCICDILKFEYDMPSNSFRGHLSCLVFSELCRCVLVSDINLGRFSVIIAANITSVPFFLSFFFFWYSHYVYITPFIVVPQSLDILFCFFFSLFFSLCFSVLEVSLVISSSSEVL